MRACFCVRHCMRPCDCVCVCVCVRNRGGARYREEEREVNICVYVWERQLVFCVCVCVHACLCAWDAVKGFTHHFSLCVYPFGDPRCKEEASFQSLFFESYTLCETPLNTEKIGRVVWVSEWPMSLFCSPSILFSRLLFISIFSDSTNTKSLFLRIQRGDKNSLFFSEALYWTQIW